MFYVPMLNTVLNASLIIMRLLLLIDFFIFSVIMPNAERIKSELLAMCNEKNGSMSRHGYQNIFIFQVR